jgi:hypothetical protein
VREPTTPKAADGVQVPGAAHGELTDPFDYATPEAQEAVRAASQLILEVRENANGPLARKVRLYERTLGIAVIPVLIRRAVLKILARRRVRRHINQ